MAAAFASMWPKSTAPCPAPTIATARPVRNATAEGVVVATGFVLRIARRLIRFFRPTNRVGSHVRVPHPLPLAKGEGRIRRRKVSRDSHLSPGYGPSPTLYVADYSGLLSRGHPATQRMGHPLRGCSRSSFRAATVRKRSGWVTEKPLPNGRGSARKRLVKHALGSQYLRTGRTARPPGAGTSRSFPRSCAPVESGR